MSINTQIIINNMKMYFNKYVNEHTMFIVVPDDIVQSEINLLQDAVSNYYPIWQSEQTTLGYDTELTLDNSFKIANFRDFRLRNLLDNDNMPVMVYVVAESDLCRMIVILSRYASSDRYICDDKITELIYREQQQFWDTSIFEY